MASTKTLRALVREFFTSDVVRDFCRGRPDRLESLMRHIRVGVVGPADEQLRKIIEDASDGNDCPELSAIFRQTFWDKQVLDLTVVTGTQTDIDTLYEIEGDIKIIVNLADLVYLHDCV